MNQKYAIFVICFGLFGLGQVVSSSSYYVVSSSKFTFAVETGIKNDTVVTDTLRDNIRHHVSDLVNQRCGQACSVMPQNISLVSMSSSADYVFSVVFHVFTLDAAASLVIATPGLFFPGSIYKSWQQEVVTNTAEATVTITEQGISLVEGASSRPASCGDGVATASVGEECDDFNLVDGDGCSSTCKLEAGWMCAGGYRPPDARNAAGSKFTTSVVNGTTVYAVSSEPESCPVTDLCVQGELWQPELWTDKYGNDFDVTTLPPRGFYCVSTCGAFPKPEGMLIQTVASDTGDTCSLVDLDECKFGLAVCDFMAYCENKPYDAATGGYACFCSQGYFPTAELGAACTDSGFEVVLLIAGKENYNAADDPNPDIAVMNTVRESFMDTLLPMGVFKSKMNKQILLDSVHDYPPQLVRVLSDEGYEGRALYEVKVRISSAMVNVMEFVSSTIFTDLSSLEAVLTDSSTPSTHKLFQRDRCSNEQGRVCSTSSDCLNGGTCAKFPAVTVTSLDAGGTSAPFYTTSTGAEIVSVSYDNSQTGWHIRLRYSPSPNAVTVLYLPRLDSPPTLDQLSGFVPDEFPCLPFGVGTMQQRRDNTVCCLDKVNRYFTTVEAFGEYMSNNNSALLQAIHEQNACLQRGSPPSNATSELLNGTQDFVVGKFQNMLRSTSTLDSTQTVGYQDVLIFFAYEDALLSGSITKPITGGVSLRFFVGMASMTLTDTTFLSTSVSSREVNSDITSSYVFSTSGTTSFTFIKDVSVDLIEVANQTTGETLKFARILVGVPADVTEDDVHGLIPLTSIVAKVGYTKDTAPAIQTFYPCINMYSGAPKAEIDSLLEAQAWCAFQDKLCEPLGPAPVNMGGQVSFIVPLTGDSWSKSGPQGILTKKLFLDFILAVKDKSGKRAMTNVETKTELTPASISTMCTEQRLESSIDSMFSIDIHLGLTNSSSLINTSLESAYDVTRSSEPVHLTRDVSTTASNILTWVIKGKEEVFSRQYSRDYSIEIEDMISVYFLSMDKKSQVDTLVASGLAVREEIVPGSASEINLRPTEQLLSICPLSVSRAALGCMTRYEIKSRALDRRTDSIVEIAPENEDTYAATMDTAGIWTQLTLGDSEFAHSAGRRHADAMNEEFDLNNRYRKAYMVSPVIPWRQSELRAEGFESTIGLSQYSISFVMLAFDQNIGTSFEPVAQVSIPGKLPIPVEQFTENLALQGALASAYAQGLGLPPNSVSIDPDSIRQEAVNETDSGSGRRRLLGVYYITLYECIVKFYETETDDQGESVAQKKASEIVDAITDVEAATADVVFEKVKQAVESACSSCPLPTLEDVKPPVELREAIKNTVRDVASCMNPTVSVDLTDLGGGTATCDKRTIDGVEYEIGVRGPLNQTEWDAVGGGYRVTEGIDGLNLGRASYDLCGSIPAHFLLANVDDIQSKWDALKAKFSTCCLCLSNEPKVPRTKKAYVHRYSWSVPTEELTQHNGWKRRYESATGVSLMNPQIDTFRSAPALSLKISKENLPPASWKFSRKTGLSYIPSETCNDIVSNYEHVQTSVSCGNQCRIAVKRYWESGGGDHLRPITCNQVCASEGLQCTAAGGKRYDCAIVNFKQCDTRNDQIGTDYLMCYCGFPSSNVVFEAGTCHDGRGMYDVQGECLDCSLSSFRSSTDFERISCQTCYDATGDAHRTTTAVGSSTVDACVCNRGYFQGSTSTCQKCPVNTFKSVASNDASLCAPCPEGLLSRAGSTAEEDCSPPYSVGGYTAEFSVQKLLGLISHQTRVQDAWIDPRPHEQNQNKRCMFSDDGLTVDCPGESFTVFPRAVLPSSIDNAVRLTEFTSSDEIVGLSKFIGQGVDTRFRVAMNPSAGNQLIHDIFFDLEPLKDTPRYLSLPVRRSYGGPHFAGFYEQILIGSQRWSPGAKLNYKLRLDAVDMDLSQEDVSLVTFITNKRLESQTDFQWIVCADTTSGLSICQDNVPDPDDASKTMYRNAAVLDATVFRLSSTKSCYGDVFWLYNCEEQAAESPTKSRFDDVFEWVPFGTTQADLLPASTDFFLYTTFFVGQAAQCVDHGCIESTFYAQMPSHLSETLTSSSIAELRFLPGTEITIQTVPESLTYEDIYPTSAGLLAAEKYTHPIPLEGAMHIQYKNIDETTQEQLCEFDQAGTGVVCRNETMPNVFAQNMLTDGSLGKIEADFAAILPVKICCDQEVDATCETELAVCHDGVDPQTSSHSLKEDITMLEDLNAGSAPYMDLLNACGTCSCSSNQEPVQASGDRQVYERGSGVFSCAPKSCKKAKKWRISNAGDIGWTPIIGEIMVYQDKDCTIEYDLTDVTKSTSIPARSGYPFSYAFDGSLTTHFRPNWTPSAFEWKITFEFSHEVQVMCVKTTGNSGNYAHIPLGMGYSTHHNEAAQRWSHGILLEASCDGINWVSAAGPDVNSNNVVADKAPEDDLSCTDERGLQLKPGGALNFEIFNAVPDVEISTQTNLAFVKFVQTHFGFPDVPCNTTRIQTEACKIVKESGLPDYVFKLTADLYRTFSVQGQDFKTHRSESYDVVMRLRQNSGETFLEEILSDHSVAGKRFFDSTNDGCGVTEPCLGAASGLIVTGETAPYVFLYKTKSIQHATSCDCQTRDTLPVTLLNDAPAALLDAKDLSACLATNTCQEACPAGSCSVMEFDASTPAPLSSVVLTALHDKDKLRVSYSDDGTTYEHYSTVSLPNTRTNQKDGAFVYGALSAENITTCDNIGSGCGYHTYADAQAFAENTLKVDWVASTTSQTCEQACVAAGGSCSENLLAQVDTKDEAIVVLANSPLAGQVAGASSDPFAPNQELVNSGNSLQYWQSVYSTSLAVLDSNTVILFRQGSHKFSVIHTDTGEWYDLSGPYYSSTISYGAYSCLAGDKSVMYVFDGPLKKLLNLGLSYDEGTSRWQSEYFVVKDIPSDVYYLGGEGKCKVSKNNKDDVWVKDHHQYYYKFSTISNPVSFTQFYHYNTKSAEPRGFEMEDDEVHFWEIRSDKRLVRFSMADKSTELTSYYISSEILSKGTNLAWYGDKLVVYDRSKSTAQVMLVDVVAAWAAQQAGTLESYADLTTNADYMQTYDSVHYDDSNNNIFTSMSSFLPGGYSMYGIATTPRTLHRVNILPPPPPIPYSNIIASCENNISLAYDSSLTMFYFNNCTQSAQEAGYWRASSLSGSNQVVSNAGRMCHLSDSTQKVCPCKITQAYDDTLVAKRLASSEEIQTLLASQPASDFAATRNTWAPAHEKDFVCVSLHGCEIDGDTYKPGTLASEAYPPNTPAAGAHKKYRFVPGDTLSSDAKVLTVQLFSDSLCLDAIDLSTGVDIYSTAVSGINSQTAPQSMLVDINQPVAIPEGAKFQIEATFLTPVILGCVRAVGLGVQRDENGVDQHNGGVRVEYWDEAASKYQLHADAIPFSDETPLAAPGYTGNVIRYPLSGLYNANSQLFSVDLPKHRYWKLALEDTEAPVFEANLCSTPGCTSEKKDAGLCPADPKTCYSTQPEDFSCDSTMKRELLTSAVVDGLNLKFVEASEECTVGSYYDPSTATCTECALGQSTPFAGATRAEQCGCFVGTYGDPFGPMKGLKSLFSQQTVLADEVGQESILIADGGSTSFVDDAERGLALDYSKGNFHIISDPLTALLNQDAWTVTMWLNLDSIGAYTHVLNAWDTSTFSPPFAMEAVVLDSGLIQFRRKRSDGGFATTTQTFALQAATWYHLAFTSSASGLKIYVNGVEKESASHSSTWLKDSQSPYNYIGLSSYCMSGTGCGSAVGFGLRQGLRFYDRELSSTEIAVFASQTGAQIGMCKACPAGMTTEIVGAQTAAACGCLKGSYFQKAFKYESLTAWYKFEKDAQDYGPNGVHLQPRLDATPSFSPDGHIIANDDISYLLPTPQTVIPTGTTTLTVSFWVKNWVDGYIMRWVPSNIYFWESSNDATQFEAAVESSTLKHLLATNTAWSLMVAVFDTTGTTLYKDGVKIANSSTAKIPAEGFEQESGQDVGIFCNPNSASSAHDFQGEFKDLRFYTAAFTAEEVGQLYQDSPRCVSCGTGLTTAGFGATSASECNVCEQGSYMGSVTSDTPSAPSGFVSTEFSANNRVKGVSLSNDGSWAVFIEDTDIRHVDLADPAQPITTILTGVWAEGICLDPADNSLYFGDNYAKLLGYDMSDPISPVQKFSVSQVNRPRTPCVVTSDGKVIWSDWYSIFEHDSSSGSQIKNHNINADYSTRIKALTLAGTNQDTIVFVRDESVSKLFKLDRDTSSVSFFSGSGTVGTLDGSPENAQFELPSSLTMSSDKHTVYVLTKRGIRSVEYSTGVTSTVAGDSVTTTTGDNGCTDGNNDQATFVINTVTSGMALSLDGTYLLVPGWDCDNVRRVNLVDVYDTTEGCISCNFGSTTPSSGATSAGQCTVNAQGYTGTPDPVLPGLQAHYFKSDALSDATGGSNLIPSATYSGGYTFDNNYLEVTADTRLDAPPGEIYGDGQSDFSISFWAADVPYDGNRHILRVHVTNVILRTQMHNSNRVLFYYFKDANGNVCEAFFDLDLSGSEFTFVTVVKKGTDVRVFANGAEGGSGNYAGKTTACTAALAPGDDATLLSHGDMQFFRGKIKDMRIFDRAISTDEIKRMFTASGNPLTKCPAMQTTEAAGAQTCGCASGFYLAPASNGSASNCTACPSGMTSEFTSRSHLQCFTPLNDMRGPSMHSTHTELLPASTNTSFIRYDLGSVKNIESVNILLRGRGEKHGVQRQVSSWNTLKVKYSAVSDDFDQAYVCATYDPEHDDAVFHSAETNLLKKSCLVKAQYIFVSVDSGVLSYDEVQIVPSKYQFGPAAKYTWSQNAANTNFITLWSNLSGTTSWIEGEGERKDPFFYSLDEHFNYEYFDGQNEFFSWPEGYLIGGLTWKQHLAAGDRKPMFPSTAAALQPLVATFPSKTAYFQIELPFANVISEILVQPGPRYPEWKAVWGYAWPGRVKVFTSFADDFDLGVDSTAMLAHEGDINYGTRDARGIPRDDTFEVVFTNGPKRGRFVRMVFERCTESLCVNNPDEEIQFRAGLKTCVYKCQGCCADGALIGADSFPSLNLGSLSQGQTTTANLYLASAQDCQHTTVDNQATMRPCPEGRECKTDAYTLDYVDGKYQLSGTDVKTPTLQVRKGKTSAITFPSGHPLVISPNPEWGSAAVSQDVVVTADNVASVTVPADSAKTTLYYYCSLHETMGVGKIEVLESDGARGTSACAFDAQQDFAAKQFEFSIGPVDTSTVFTRNFDATLPWMRVTDSMPDYDVNNGNLLQTDPALNQMSTAYVDETSAINSGVFLGIYTTRPQIKSVLEPLTRGHLQTVDTKAKTVSLSTKAGYMGPGGGTGFVQKISVNDGWDRVSVELEPHLALKSVWKDNLSGMYPTWTDSRNVKVASFITDKKLESEDDWKWIVCGEKSEQIRNFPTPSFVLDQLTLVGDSPPDSVIENSKTTYKSSDIFESQGGFIKNLPSFSDINCDPSQVASTDCRSSYSSTTAALGYAKCDLSSDLSAQENCVYTVKNIIDKFFLNAFNRIKQPCGTLLGMGAKSWYVSPVLQPDHFTDATAFSLGTTQNFEFNSKGGFTLLLKTKDLGTAEYGTYFKLWVDNVVIIWVAKKTGTALMVQLQNYATSKTCQFDSYVRTWGVVEQAITYDDATKTLKASGESILFNNVDGVMVESSRSPISYSTTCGADFSLPDVNLNDYASSAIVHEVGGSGKNLKADLYGVVLFDEPLTSTQTTPLIAAFDDAAHATYSAGAAPSTSRATASALAEFQAHIDTQYSCIQYGVEVDKLTLSAASFTRGLIERTPVIATHLDTAPVLLNKGKATVCHTDLLGAQVDTGSGSTARFLPRRDYSIASNPSTGYDQKGSLAYGGFDGMPCSIDTGLVDSAAEEAFLTEKTLQEVLDLFNDKQDCVCGMIATGYVVDGVLKTNGTVDGTYLNPTAQYSFENRDLGDVSGNDLNAIDQNSNIVEADFGEDQNLGVYLDFTRYGQRAMTIPVTFAEDKTTGITLSFWLQYYWERYEGAILWAQKTDSSSTNYWNVGTMRSSNIRASGKFNNNAYHRNAGEYNGEGQKLVGTSAWIHLTFVHRQSGGWHIYRNGILWTTHGTAAHTFQGDWTFKFYNSHDHNAYRLSDVRFFDRELSQAEINQVAAGPKLKAIGFPPQLNAVSRKQTFRVERTDETAADGHEHVYVTPLSKDDTQSAHVLGRGYLKPHVSMRVYETDPASNAYGATTKALPGEYKICQDESDVDSVNGEMDEKNPHVLDGRVISLGKTPRPTYQPGVDGLVEGSYQNSVHWPDDACSYMKPHMVVDRLLDGVLDAELPQLLLADASFKHAGVLEDLDNSGFFGWLYPEDQIVNGRPTFTEQCQKDPLNNNLPVKTPCMWNVAFDGIYDRVTCNGRGSWPMRYNGACDDVGLCMIHLNLPQGFNINCNDYCADRGLVCKASFRPPTFGVCTVQYDYGCSATKHWWSKDNQYVCDCGGGDRTLLSESDTFANAVLNSDFQNVFVDKMYTKKQGWMYFWFAEHVDAPNRFFVLPLTNNVGPQFEIKPGTMLIGGRGGVGMSAERCGVSDDYYNEKGVLSWKPSIDAPGTEFFLYHMFLFGESHACRHHNCQDAKVYEDSAELSKIRNAKIDPDSNPSLLIMQGSRFALSSLPKVPFKMQDNCLQIALAAPSFTDGQIVTKYYITKTNALFAQDFGSFDECLDCSGGVCGLGKLPCKYFDTSTQKTYFTAKVYTAASESSELFTFWLANVADATSSDGITLEGFAVSAPGVPELSMATASWQTGDKLFTTENKACADGSSRRRALLSSLRQVRRKRPISSRKTIVNLARRMNAFRRLKLKEMRARDTMKLNVESMVLPQRSMRKLLTIGAGGSEMDKTTSNTNMQREVTSLDGNRVMADSVCGSLPGFCELMRVSLDIPDDLYCSPESDIIEHVDNELSSLQAVTVGGFHFKTVSVYRAALLTKCFQSTVYSRRLLGVTSHTVATAYVSLHNALSTQSQQECIDGQHCVLSLNLEDTEIGKKGFSAVHIVTDQNGEQGVRVCFGGPECHHRIEISNHTQLSMLPVEVKSDAPSSWAIIAVVLAVVLFIALCFAAKRWYDSIPKYKEVSTVATNDYNEMGQPAYQQPLYPMYPDSYDQPPSTTSYSYLYTG